jgi:sulfur-carrier protein adenylyltransferase/sulfurtransferase
MTLSPSELLRYSRHLALPEIGLAGQEKLQAARVLVVGAGGLGSPCALYLAAAGVGTLGVVDHDRVDESNLQRQVLFDTAGIGAPKAELARRRLSALNPRLEIIAHALELHAGNVEALLRDYQLIIDGSDRVSTRYLVNDACVLYRKPLISAAIHRFEGQAMTYVPGRSPCYRCLFPEPAEGLVPSCAQAGVLGVLPGVLGSLQATEAIKLIVGVGEPLLGRLLTYDALALRFDEFRFTRRSDCAVCGDTPSIRAPQDPPGFCSLEELARVPQISAGELATRLTSGRAVGLIDVREPREFLAGHLGRAVNIPLPRLEAGTASAPFWPEDLAAPAADLLVFICRSGVRSRKACALARRAGLDSSVQLEGGLLSWQAEIEPSLTLAD